MYTNIAARFEHLIEQLCRRLTGFHPGRARTPRRLSDPEVMLINNRLRLIARQFAAVLLRLAAGTLRRPPPPRAANPPGADRPSAIPPGAEASNALRPTDAAQPRPRQPRLGYPHRLKNTLRWLTALDRSGAYAGDALHRLFGDPDMQALLDAAPQLRRILRPLCTMLGVEPPPDPRLPPPRRPRRRNFAWPFVPNRRLPQLALAMPPPAKNV